MKQPWQTPEEIRRNLVPGARDSVYDEFVDDILLRLERTTSNSAIRYPFDNAETAKLYRRSAAQIIRRLRGPGYISTRLNGSDLYVWRGKNYGNATKK